MVELYHGTTPSVAIDLKNCKVDVEKGGGEFGKGFYLGNSRRLAKRRAFHKTEGKLGTAREAMNAKDNTFIVTIDDIELKKYFKQKLLSRVQARDLFSKLCRDRATASYVVRPEYDYILGPVAGRKGRYLCVDQYKFDSEKSQDILNKKCTIVTIETGII